MKLEYSSRGDRQGEKIASGTSLHKDTSTYEIFLSHLIKIVEFFS